MVGITEQLQDHSLQQFVNSRTSRPIQFHYEAFNYQGIDVGVIRVDLSQNRPLYLKQDYGKLRAREVYVRRGSSTDPTRPATPEEIADMGRTVPTTIEPPELRVQFADIEREAAIGTATSWEAKVLTFPHLSEIPDYSENRTFDSLVIGSVNSKFYRELATYAAFKYLYRPVRLLIENAGPTLASDVRIELNIVSATGVSVKGYGPSKPRRRLSLSDINPGVYRDIRPMHRTPGNVEIIESKDGSRLEVECQNMQPGRKLWSDKFYVAVRTNATTAITGSIFAATLPQPQEFSLMIEATIQQEAVSVDDLRRIAKELRA